VNDTQAAQFVFGDKLDSYSNRGGSHTQTGIIGVAWFPEKIVRVAPTLTYNQTKHMWNPNTPVTPMWSVQNICDPDQTLGAQVLRGSIIGATMGATESKQVASAANAQQTSLGTQFGESVSYPTTPTAFERTSSEPQCVSMIYYDHAQNLIRMGIKLKPRTLPYADAFPGNNVSYCEPPPGWTHKKW
jgi:hypothetical protein